MVKIRLKRIGTTKRPVYRLVVADSRSPRDGRFIEAIGFYDPLPTPAVVRIDEDRVRMWMKRGARPSDTARQLLVQQGVLAATPRPVREAATSAPREAAPAAAGAGGARTAEPASSGAAEEVVPAAPDSGGSTSDDAGAGDAAGGSPAPISEEAPGGVPATAGPAPEETEAEQTEPAEEAGT